MLYWAVIFFIIAIVAGLSGFGWIASGAQAISIWLFWGSVVGFAITVILGILKRLK